ncbi:MAG: hypothetical protein ACWA40_07795 [Planktomarina sp.]
MSTTVSNGINFGDNTNEYANDGECDDRRFIGRGMASSLNDERTMHDAADCKRAFEAGQIQLVSEAAGRAVTQCSKIDFGNNSSQFANDGECDDFRFDGPGTDNIMLSSDIKSDATDCRRACDAGQIWLRTPAR